MSWTLVFLALTVMSWIYWLVACWCVSSFFGEAQPEPGAELPPVSVIKPMRGLDAGAYENLAGFLTQDYPDYEVLFGVTDPSDPALDLVRRLRRAYPRRSIRAYVAPRCGANDKVSVLCYLAARARHDTLVISDSDMRVGPDYLRRVTAPLRDPAVGLVTCLYRGVEAQSVTAVLEALYMSATFLPSALVARRYLRMRFALGASNAVRRQQLAEIGGFEALADCLADDYELGARVAATGSRVHLSGYVMQSALGPTTFAQQWYREVRWARCTRVSRPLEYPGFVATFSLPLALLFAASTGFAAMGWGVVILSLAVRWFVSWEVSAHTGDPLLREAWLWLPLRDVLTAIVWCAAGVGRRVNWRDRQYVLVEGGRLQEMVSRSPRPAAR